MTLCIFTGKLATCLSKTFFLVSLGNYFLTRTYNLKNSPEACFIFNTDSTCKGISSSVTEVYLSAGNLTLTKLDTLQKIASGLFNCTIPIPDCDSLYVTDGRFDLGQ